MFLLFIMSKTTITMIFGVIAGLTAIGVAVTQWFDQKESEKQKAKYEDSIKTANAEIIDLQRQALSITTINLKRADKTIENTEKLTTLLEENAKLQEELKNQVTGGHSKPRLILYTANNNEIGLPLKLIYFDLVIEGKYPLHQVRMQIADPWGSYASPYAKMIKFAGGRGLQLLSPPNFNNQKNWDLNKNIDIGTINPKQRVLAYETVFASFDNGGGTAINYDMLTVDIFWNSGFIRYSLEIDFSTEKPTLKNVSVLDNYKHVDWEKYLEFNKFANE